MFRRCFSSPSLPDFESANVASCERAFAIATPTPKHKPFACAARAAKSKGAQTPPRALPPHRILKMQALYCKSFGNSEPESETLNLAFIL